MSTGMVVLSEAPVTISLSHHDSMYTVNVPWCSVVIRDHQSVTAKSQFHAYSNVRWMVLPGWITKVPPHLIYNVSHTHTHTHTHTKCTMRNGAATKIHQSQHCLVNSPFVYTMKGDITHRWPLRSHTKSPSWWFTHACSKPLAQSSETTGAITIGLPNIPVLCTVNSLLVPSPLVRHRPTHTPWSAKDAVHSPVSVRTTLWLPNRRQHPDSLMLNATGQALSPHTPHGQLKDAVHSPASVRTILWLPNPGQHSYCC